MGYQNDLKYHKMILLLALKSILDHPYILHSFLRYSRYKFSTRHNGGIPALECDRLTMRYSFMRSHRISLSDRNMIIAFKSQIYLLIEYIFVS